MAAGLDVDGSVDDAIVENFDGGDGSHRRGFGMFPKLFVDVVREGGAMSELVEEVVDGVEA